MTELVRPVLPSAIALCGKGRIASAALRLALHFLSCKNISIPVLACPNRNDPGYHTWTHSLIKTAKDNDVKLVEWPQLSHVENLMLLSLEFDRIVRTTKMSLHSAFNVHFSALPKYRGVYTSIMPILHGEKISGVTLHEIDEGIDTGPIIAQRIFAIGPGMTARELYERYMDEGIVLVGELFGHILSGDYEAHPQDHENASYFSRQSLDLTHLEIDLEHSAEEVARFVRALHFPEYQLPRLSGRAVAVANLLSVRSSASPGTLLSRLQGSSAFVCGDGGVVELVWG